MEKFSNIYPFTTENIAGYMSGLNLKDKKIITVTGSSDHILNAILQGATDITTFDINKLTKYYMDLKIGGINKLSYIDFCKIFLFENKESFNAETIKAIDMPSDSKRYWDNELTIFNNDGLAMRNSGLLNLKFFNSISKIKNNLYLSEENYAITKDRLPRVKITYLDSRLEDLKLHRRYDYMFLSNIADYLKLMFSDNELESYKMLIDTLQEYVNTIYIAYLYDIENNHPRSAIDNLKLVQQVFHNIEIKKFRSALEGSTSDRKDGVLILSKGGK